VVVFVKLNKIEEAFEFLTALESMQVEDHDNGAGYRSAVATIIEHVATLSKEEIENRFMSQTFTERQEREIYDYLSDARPNLLVVQEFWRRKPVSAVGLAIKLNWDEQQQNAQLKEIRKEAVRLFTGVGTSTNIDGVFTRDEKRAANLASSLNQDALEF